MPFSGHRTHPTDVMFGMFKPLAEFLALLPAPAPKLTSENEEGLQGCRPDRDNSVRRGHEDRASFAL